MGEVYETEIHAVYAGKIRNRFVKPGDNVVCVWYYYCEFIYSLRNTESDFAFVINLSVFPDVFQKLHETVSGESVVCK